MNNKEKLNAFFTAENKRDWEAYRDFLHPDVKWTLYGETTREIKGIDAYMDAIKNAYNNSGDTFRCESMYTNGDRIAAILVNSRNGRSIDIFEFENGLICREYEFIF